MIVTIFQCARAGLLASGAVLALVAGPSVASAAPLEVMLINAKTGKCLTVAGGITPNNNHPIVQFDCDRDPSRRWRLSERSTGVFQIRNVRTGKCLTIAGGITPNNNHPAVQFDCDSHPSRIWRIGDVTGNGVHQIRNVQTGKCVTIAGGTTSDNNHPSVQFDCDSDESRRWTMRLKL
jgi:cytolethal distending toxin subunit A